jgi:hypothetical protein
MSGRSSPAHQLALRPGTVLRNQHRIDALLGRPGGFGIAYLAQDLRLDVAVAVKEFLPAELAGRAGDRATVLPHSESAAELFQVGLQQFLVESQTLARLNHPGIVRVRDFFEENGTAYLVMDYYEGITLAELLAEEGRLPVAQAVDLVVRVLDALNAAHQAGILHRDVKPSNLYLTRDGRPILLDFGAARQAVGQKSRSLTTILTPGYAPVEQYARQGRRQGPWTDVYACAAVLYRMITGTEPPDAPERMSGEDELKPARSLVPGLSHELDRAILKGLAVQPHVRPQSALEFSDLLTGRVAAPANGAPGGGVQPHVPPPPPKPPQPADAGSGAGRVIGGLVAAGAVLAAISMARGGNAGVDAVPVVVADTTMVAPAYFGADTTAYVAPPPPPPPPPPAPPAYASDIAELGATVVGVRFFEGGAGMPPVAQRRHRYRFSQTSARYVNWELRLNYPTTIQNTSFAVEAIYYRPDGTVFSVDTVRSYVDAGWSDSYLAHGRGWSDQGNWPAGVYRVEFLNHGRRIATGTFEIVPAGTLRADFPEIGARITDLRFFECAAQLPPSGSEHFRYRFPSASTGYICYRLDMTYPRTDRASVLLMEIVIYNPDGSEHARFEAPLEPGAGWTGSGHRGGWGSTTPGGWATGTYRMEFLHQGRRVAMGSFEVY